MDPIDFICFHCQHWSTPFGCPAFPDGVPFDSEIDENGHRVKLPNQIGDYVFTPKEGDYMADPDYYKGEKMYNILFQTRPELRESLLNSYRERKGEFFLELAKKGELLK